MADQNAFASTPDSNSAMQVRRPRSGRPPGMSYKFQRLRERLREAVQKGEFTGKLPGERALAKRFHVNAKTLSKALTDLAAEGLLDRSIGRGTYVKGQVPAAHAEQRWLVICDRSEDLKSGISNLKSQISDGLVAGLVTHNPRTEAIADLARMRPSFINQFQAVIIAAANTPDSLLRDLAVRALPVVAVGHEPRAHSMHAVLADTPLNVAKVARELMLAGHRQIVAMQAPGQSTLAEGLHVAAARYAWDGDARIEPCGPQDVGHVVEELAKRHFTAVVCDSPAAARAVHAAAEERGISVPRDASIVAIGCIGGDGARCSGYYVTQEQVCAAVADLLRDPPVRPRTIWLAGDRIDVGTIAPVAETARAVRSVEMAPALQFSGVRI